MTSERQFGPYRLVKQIAVGGMAEIYLAKTRGIAGFEKYVALKMIHPNFSSDENFIEMLIDEAKISVQLQHANVAQTFDLGRVGDTYYITIEFVDGADLYKLLRRAAEKDIEIPVDIAAYVAKEMANGLDYAHRRRDISGEHMGIVHRDVSPQNVLISHSGEVKLVDFGIAKATMKARQTAVGVIKGKYYYMSPEQAWGDPVDHRTDIFSAGILLYELLTGQMLYLEEDLHRLLDMVRKANIAPPSTLRRGIPPQLERIVMNALKKKKEDRYQTAGDMASDLERFLHTYSPVFTPGKLAGFFQSVLDDDAPLSSEIIEPVAEEVIPSLITMRLESDELLRERSEFADENSVIFRVKDMEKKAAARAAGQAPAMAPSRPPAGPPGRPPARTPPRPPLPPGRAPAMAPGRPPAPRTGTRPLAAAEARSIAGFDNIEEQTMVSGPPGFGGVPASASINRSDFAGDSEFEPTFIDNQLGQTGDRGSGNHDDDDDGSVFDEMEEGPTLQRDPELVQRTVADAMRDERPAALRAGGSSRKGQANPALRASTPQPALSELRPPRQSRKTPAKGVPAAPGPSVLSTLIGSSAAAGPPVRRGSPTQPAEGTGPPDNSMESDQPGSLQPGQQPGYGQPYGQQPFAYPPSAFSPLPSGSIPMSFTQQIKLATETEEVPDAYKIGSKKPRWLLRVILAGICVAAGAAIGIFVFTGDSGTRPTSLNIASFPPGARVKVNGTPLPDPTPTLWADARPGERYSVELSLEGHETRTQDVVIDSDGGEIKMLVQLSPQRGTLEVKTTPPGAEVRIDSEVRGRTPLTLRELDPTREQKLELRYPGMRPHKETLIWGGKTELARDITLSK